jgi:quinoprotein glucose dehydrogenase
MKVAAVDAETGAEIWKFDPSGGATGTARARHRGVTVYQDRVFVTYRSFLYALDRKTGQPLSSFGTNGRIDLREGLDQPAQGLSVSASTPGSIFEDMIIVGTAVPETLPGSPGHIRAFDVNTGRCGGSSTRFRGPARWAMRRRGRRMRTSSRVAPTRGGRDR